MSKPEEKKVSRRTYLQVVGGTAAGLVLGGALGYLGKPTAPVAPPETVTSTVTETVTGTVTATAPPTFSFKGVKLRALLYSQPASEAAQKLKSDWEVITGASVSTDLVDHSSLSQKSMMDFTGHTGLYDITAMDIPWVASWGEGGFVADLLQFLNDPKTVDPNYNLGDIFERIVKAYTWKGKLTAISYAPSVNFIFYRKDLFEDMTEGAAFKAKYGYELKPPETMDQLWDVAEFFTRKKGEQLAGKPLAEDFYGYADAPKRGEHATWAWFPFMISWHGESFLRPVAPTKEEECEVTLDWKESIDSLEFFRKLHGFAPPGFVNWAHDEVNALLQRGSVAVALHQAELAASMEDPAASKVVGLIGYSAVPAKKVKSAGLGGMSIAVNNDSKNKLAAYKFVEWLTSPTIGKKLADLGGPPFRVSVIEDPELSKKYPFYKGFQDALGYAVMRPPVPEYPDMSEAISSAVQSVLLQEKTAQQALTEAATTSREILQKAGYRVK